MIAYYWTDKEPNLMREGIDFFFLFFLFPLWMLLMLIDQIADGFDT